MPASDIYMSPGRRPVLDFDDPGAGLVGWAWSKPEAAKLLSEHFREYDPDAPAITAEHVRVVSTLLDFDPSGIDREEIEEANRVIRAIGAFTH